MAPITPVLAQSESKTRFFERLGLNDRNEYHRRLYAMMKEEAIEGRRRMTEDLEALLPELRASKRIEPPYSHAHVSEAAVQREILRIYRYARPDTRQIYDLGRDTDRIDEENWIIRWMLWHVFRYRDNRNKSRRPSSALSVSGHRREMPAAVVKVVRCQSPATSTHRTSRYWDPVRDRW